MSSTDASPESVARREGYWVMVRRDSTQSPKKLHIPDPRDDDVATLCNEEVYQGGSAVTKDIAAIPPDYYPLCRYCASMAQEGSS